MNMLSRRHFLQMTGGILCALAFTSVTEGRGVVRTDQADTDISAESSQNTLNSAMERWLLSTGSGDIDADIYALLTSEEVAVPHKVFLPSVQH